MRVNDTQFNVELMDVLTELRSQLAANGIERFSRMFDSGEDIMVCCPYHKNGQERRPSCGIRKADGQLHCLACGKTVGLDEMIANCFGKSDPIWGYQWLTRNFLTVSVINRGEIKLDYTRDRSEMPQNGFTFVPDAELDLYRYTHPYMYKRGLTDEIIEYFDIGYDKKTDSITFPVRYWGALNNGECMFIARRQIKTKRFDIPKNVEKPLYGLYEIWKLITEAPLTDVSVYFEDKFIGAYTTGHILGIDKIYVCEGLFDALRLWCNGKCAVAGFGCLFSEYQIKQLEGLPTRHLVLATDNDDAGRAAKTKLRKQIKNKLITEVIIPDGKKDIGDLTDTEILRLKEVF